MLTLLFHFTYNCNRGIQHARRIQEYQFTHNVTFDRPQTSRRSSRVLGHRNSNAMWRLRLAKLWCPRRRKRHYLPASVFHSLRMPIDSGLLFMSIDLEVFKSGFGCSVLIISIHICIYYISYINDYGYRLFTVQPNIHTWKKAQYVFYIDYSLDFIFFLLL